MSNSNTLAKDNIYSEALDQVPDFAFDAGVVKVFDDMISRSVPLYRDVQKVSFEIARRVVKKNANIYDLGCSTGTTLLEYCRLEKESNLNIVGVDNSKPMLKAAKERLALQMQIRPITLIESDLCSFQPENACFISINYTLQFLAPEQRQLVLKRCFDALVPGGALLLSEKVRHRHDQLDNFIFDLHLDFKRANGYSDLEISQKREALENVMIPVSSEENLHMLSVAGFSEHEILLKSLNFASFLARK